MKYIKIGDRSIRVNPDINVLCRPGSVLFQKEINIDDLIDFKPLLYTSIVEEGRVPVNCTQTTLNAINLLPRDRAQHEGYLSEGCGGTHNDQIENYIQSLVPYEVSQTQVFLHEKIPDVLNFLEENLKINHATIVRLFHETGLGHMGMFFKDDDGEINMFEGQNVTEENSGILPNEFILEHILSNEWTSIVFFCVSEKKRKMEHGIRKTRDKTSKIAKLPLLSNRKSNRTPRRLSRRKTLKFVR